VFFCVVWVRSSHGASRLPTHHSSSVGTAVGNAFPPVATGANADTAVDRQSGERSAAVNAGKPSSALGAREHSSAFDAREHSSAFDAREHSSVQHG